jgi:hypothetical protein
MFWAKAFRAAAAVESERAEAVEAAMIGCGSTRCAAHDRRVPARGRTSASCERTRWAHLAERRLRNSGEG